MYYFKYICNKKYIRTSRSFFFLISFCLLTIVISGLICYDNDLSDNNDPPIIALRYPVLVYAANDEVTFIPLINDPISLPFINKNPVLSRAPPA
jgi:hypothetical protein